MKDLGLRLSTKKSVLSPVQKTTYLGVVWDLTTMQAHLSPASIESIVKRVRESQSLTVKLFQKLLGLMASASNVITFGTRDPWFRTTGFSPRGNPFHMIKVMRRCLRGLRHVEETMFPVTRPCVGGSMSSRNANDGCLPHRLGSGHVGLLCPRSVGRSPSHVAHKLAGDAGSFSSVETLSPRPERPSCASTHRQYVGGFLHQQPESEFWNWIKGLIFKCLLAGGSALAPPLQAGAPDPPVGLLSSSTLNVYMATIAAHHSPVCDQYLGRNQLVTRLHQGIRRLRWF